MRITVYALALMAVCGAMLADAQAVSRACGPLKQVASLEMSVLADGARESVPLTIDGKTVWVLVDTGAGMSSLTKPAATMLDIRARESEAMHLVGKDGVAIHRYYVAASFQLGQLTAKDIPFLQNEDIGETRLSGAIGPDLMLRYDVEMDFSQQRLTYFSQDHCPGHVVHWSNDVVTGVPISLAARARDFPPAMPPGAVGDLQSDVVDLVMAHTITPILGTDIRTKVMLDGHLFTANIDTGSEVSTVNSRAVQDVLDVPADAPRPQASQSRPDQPAPPGTEAVTVTQLRHQRRFHSLTFGGVEVVSPLLVLNPGHVHRVGDAKSPDITIGMNILRKLHLYFAFGEKMLYVSAAAAQAQTSHQ
jgi:hypothetical protein